MGISPKNIRRMEDDGLLRIDWVVPLIFDVASDPLRDAIRDMELSKVEEVFGKNKYLKQLFEEDDNESILQFIKENYYDKLLAHISTPVMDGKMFSWGHYYSDYVLVESLDELVEAGMKWKDKINKKSDKKKVK